MNKYQHVRNATQTRRHFCHWPGCKKQVKPAFWGCRKHWYMLPLQLRRRIWAAYRPGQEEDGRVSDEYMAVSHAVQQWITENYGGANGRVSAQGA